MVLTVWTRRARAAFILTAGVRRTRAVRPARVRGVRAYGRPRARSAVHQHIGPAAPIGSHRSAAPVIRPSGRIASPALSRGQLSGTGTGAGAWVAVAPPTALLYSLRVLNALVNTLPDQW